MHTTDAALHFYNSYNMYVLNLINLLKLYFTAPQLLVAGQTLFYTSELKMQQVKCVAVGDG